MIMHTDSQESGFGALRTQQITPWNTTFNAPIASLNAGSGRGGFAGFGDAPPTSIAAPIPAPVLKSFKLLIAKLLDLRKKAAAEFDKINRVDALDESFATVSATIDSIAEFADQIESGTIVDLDTGTYRAATINDIIGTKHVIDGAISNLSYASQIAKQDIRNSAALVALENYISEVSANVQLFFSTLNAAVNAGLTNVKTVIETFAALNKNIGTTIQWASYLLPVLGLAAVAGLVWIVVKDDGTQTERLGKIGTKAAQGAGYAFKAAKLAAL